MRMQERLSKLPSLDNLKGFIATGRRMSITQAAGDLCLSQSAVSRQIIALEESLGVPLFVRRHRALTFTNEGSRFYEDVKSMFETLSEAIEAISENVGRERITITASVGVAATWLLPKLRKLQERLPRIDVHVAADNRVLDLEKEGIDLAIRYCRTDQVPINAIHLFDETIAPVAHPTLAESDIETPHGLSQITLLAFDDRTHAFLNWDDWLAPYGLDSTQAKAVLRFNQYDQVIQTAIAGQGVALGRFPLLDSFVTDARLARIGDPSKCPRPDHQYCLLSPHANPSPLILSVREWIEEEAAAAI